MEDVHAGDGVELDQVQLASPLEETVPDRGRETVPGFILSSKAG